MMKAIIADDHFYWRALPIHPVAPVRILIIYSRRNGHVVSADNR